MSLDIELTQKDDPVHVAFLLSAGIVRFFIKDNGHVLQLSEPVPIENLKQLQQALNDLLEDTNE